MEQIAKYVQLHDCIQASRSAVQLEKTEQSLTKKATNSPTSLQTIEKVAHFAAKNSIKKATLKFGISDSTACRYYLKVFGKKLAKQQSEQGFL